MSELTYKRGIADVTRDIRIKTGQFLMDAIEIGRLLFEAKSMVEPGSWGKYVEEELPFSHSWAEALAMGRSLVWLVSRSTFSSRCSSSSSSAFCASLRLAPFIRCVRIDSTFLALLISRK